ncbi:unnamed protein product [Larinioides sclopetarius]|uniref:Uncharacterized protein n=1 Tax=Larinioides sclopetarius TaxID=280406 RepID=A0AAV2BA53_9ARAC
MHDGSGARTWSGGPIVGDQPDAGRGRLDQKRKFEAEQRQMTKRGDQKEDATRRSSEDARW